MENPATWGPVQKIIYATRREWEQNQQRGIIGYSLESALANALSEANLLSEEANIAQEQAKHNPELSYNRPAKPAPKPFSALAEELKTTRLWD